MSSTSTSFIGTPDLGALLYHLELARLTAESEVRDALNIAVEKQAIIAALTTEIERLQLVIDQKCAEKAEPADQSATEPAVEEKLAAEPVRRALNPRGRNGDPTVYSIKNLDGRSTKGTQAQLKARLGMGHVKFHQLLNTPGRVTREGWYRPTTRAARGVKGE